MKRIATHFFPMTLLCYLCLLQGSFADGYNVGALSSEENIVFDQCIAGLEQLERFYTHVIVECKETKDQFDDESHVKGRVSRTVTFMSNGRDYLRIDRTGYTGDDSYSSKGFVTPDRYVAGNRYDNNEKYVIDDISGDIVEGVSTITISRFAFAPFGFWVLPIRDCFVDTAEPPYRWRVLKINETTIDGEAIVAWEAKVSDQMEGKLCFYKDKNYALKSYYVCIKNEKLEKRKEIFFDCQYEGTLKYEGVTVPKIKHCEYLHKILGTKGRTAEHLEFDFLGITPQIVLLDEFNPEKVMGVKIGKPKNYFWLWLMMNILGLAFILIWLYLTARQKNTAAIDC